MSESRSSTKIDFYNARPADFVPTQACSESVPRSSSSRAGGGDLGGMSDRRLPRLVDWRSDGNRSGSHHSMPWPARSEQSVWVMVSCRVGKTGTTGDVVDGKVDLQAKRTLRQSSGSERSAEGSETRTRPKRLSLHPGSQARRHARPPRATVPHAYPSRNCQPTSDMSWRRPPWTCSCPSALTGPTGSRCLAEAGSYVA